MYLSRVEIDTKNRKKIQDLTHLGAYHNWVEKSFPKEISAKDRSRKLWRIDQIRSKKYLLIVSSEKPDPEKLEMYGVKGSSATKPYDTFIKKLKTGMRAHFRIVLNPVKSVSDGISKRGRVMPHVTVAQQRKFLMDRAEKNGFKLSEDEFSIVERGYEPLKKGCNHIIRISKVTYEGILTITDEVIIRKTLILGFGKKKAYGFGMMTLIPEN